MSESASADDFQPLLGSDPTAVANYQLLGRLGSGGFGVVYAATDSEDKQVAIKVLRAELSDDQRFRRRLAREAEALRRVSGNRTVEIIDVVTEGDQAYLVMELLKGETLDDRVESEGPLQAALLWFAAQGLIEALRDIHAAGIIHRDLKPSNVMYGPDGIKVLDFGISVVAEETSLTQTGAFMGTAAWISPEQIKGKEVSEATDVFNFGLVMAFAATGRHPFGEGRSDALMYRISSEEPDLSDVPSPVKEALEHCLARDPEDRPSIAVLAEFFNSNGATGLETGVSDTVIVSAGALDDAVGGGGNSGSGTRVVQSPFEPQPPSSPTPPRKVGLVAASVIAVAAIGAFFVLRNTGDEAAVDLPPRASSNGGPTTDPPDTQVLNSDESSSSVPVVVPDDTTTTSTSEASTTTEPEVQLAPTTIAPPTASSPPPTTSSSIPPRTTTSTTTTTIPPPQPPSNFQVSAEFDSRYPNGSVFKLTWKQEAGVTYEMYESTNGSSFIKFDSCSCPGIERIKPSVDENDSFYFHLVGRNSSGNSTPREQVVASASKPLPGKPSNVTVTQTSNTSPTVRLSWSAPAVDKCGSSWSCPTYRIEQSLNGGLSWSIVATSTTSTSRTISNSTWAWPWGASGQFRVRASNSYGPSTWTYSATYIPTTTPGTPRSATACRVGSSNNIRLSWSSPTSNGGTPITGHKLSWGSTSTNATSSPQQISMTSPSGTVRIYAINAKGQSSSYASIYISSSTFSTPTCAGTAIPAFSEPTITSNGTKPTIVIPAKPSGFDSYGQTFGVYIFANSYTKSTTNYAQKCGSWTYSSTPWSGSCTSPANALTAGTTYYARYYIKDINGTFDWSDEKSFTVSRPAVPTFSSPTVTSTTGNSATIAVPSKPSGFDTYGASFNVYVFSNSYTKSTSASQVKASCGWSYATTPWNGTCTTASGDPLTPGTTYYARYYLSDTTNRKSWSDPRSFTIPAPPLPDLPAPSLASNNTNGVEAELNFPTVPATWDATNKCATARIDLFSSDNTTTGASHSRSYACGSLWQKKLFGANLSPGTTYYARAYLKDIYGQEKWSPGLQFTTVPPFPSSLSTPVIGPVGTTSVTVNLPSKPSQYDFGTFGATFSVYITGNNSNWPPSTSSGYLTATCGSWSYNSTPWNGTCTVPAGVLDPDTMYYAMFYLEDSIGRRQSSNRHFTTEMPQFPSTMNGQFDLTVASKTASTITLRVPPLLAEYDPTFGRPNHCADTRIELRLWPPSGSLLQSRNTGCSAWNQLTTFSGLSPDTMYSFTIILVDQFGRSGSSVRTNTDTDSLSPFPNLTSGSFDPVGVYFGGVSQIFKVPSLPVEYNTNAGGTNHCASLKLYFYWTLDGPGPWSAILDVGCSAWGTDVQINTPPHRPLSAIFELTDQFGRNGFSNSVPFISGGCVLSPGSNSCQ